MVMILVAFLLPLVVDGPADDDFFADQTKGCYKNWWTAMTLSLNFNGVSETIIQVLFWIFSVALSSFVIFVTTPWNRGQLPGPWINALYAGLHRLVWTFPLWWLHFACANGHAGIVNRFLSAKIFQLFGRLVFGAYLIHIVLFLVRMGVLQTMLQVNEFLQMLHFFGIWALSMIFAYVLNLLCEAPVDQLDKLVFEASDARMLAMDQSRTANNSQLPHSSEKENQKSRL
ncbi:O-acyltransferase like protein-like [Ixodes scapularis]